MLCFHKVMEFNKKKKAADERGNERHGTFFGSVQFCDWWTERPVQTAPRTPVLRSLYVDSINQLFCLPPHATAQIKLIAVSLSFVLFFSNSTHSI